MASHYDRPPVPYATRHSPIAGSSRGDPFYDREHRPTFPPPDIVYAEDERISARRDDRLYYPPQEFVVPPRELRGDPWGHDDPWYSRTFGYPRRSSPPLPQPTTYPPQYQDFRTPPSPQWEERPRRVSVPESLGFEPSVAWRHTHREPTSSRLNSLLNPAPPSPEVDDRRWREPEPGPPPPRDYGRPYPPDYYAYDYRQPAYYDRTSYPEVDAYRPHQPYDDRPAHWPSSTYRPGPPVLPRPNRPSAIRDYKRPRQVSLGQSPRVSDNGTPHWNREKGADSSRNSCEGSLSSPLPANSGDRERTATGSSQIGTRSALVSSTSASPASGASRPTWEVPAEVNFTGDERNKGTTQSGQIPKLVPNETARLNESLKQVGPAPVLVPPRISNREQVLFSSLSQKTVSLGKPAPNSVNRLGFAWNPSNDEGFSAGDDSRLRSPQAEKNAQGVRSAPVSDGKFSDLSRQVSPVRHDSSEARPAEVSFMKADDARVPDSAEPSNARPQGSVSSRQGVMSVQNLVSSTPVKLYAPVAVSQKPPTPLLDNSDMQVDTPQNEQLLSARHPSISQAPAPLVACARAIEMEEAPDRSVSFSRIPIQVLSPWEPDRRATLSVEPSVVGLSQNETPSTQTPDADADKTLAEVEVQVAKATLSSPKPSTLPLVQSVEEVTQNGAMRILPPRPKVDDKAIVGTLRRAIMARRTLSTQTREQRVNPILMDNLAKADEPVKRLSTSPELLIEEVLENVFSRSKEEQQMNTRSVLATNFAAQRESMAEKTQKLRNEYLRLNEQWIAHCAHLDSLFKANDMQEATTLTGRTTRRSAATLGDAVRSDLEMEQIIASLGNEDLTDPNHLAVRNVATIPDMISVEKGRVDYLFDDTNGLVDNPDSFYDLRSGFLDWTPEEEATFYAKYAESPKQFGIVSTFLPHKTTSQCVLYYYIHKKRLIDFRNAANSGNGKRRKGVRKGGKQKGNALLVDVQQADSKRPAGRGRRRGRGGGPGDGGRGRGAGVQCTEASVDQDSRSKRRRTNNTAKIVLAKEMDFEESQSVDTDQTREVSVVPPKKRRGRKPRVIVAEESPAASPVPGEAKFIDANEALGRRKSTTSSSHWSETDRDEFIRLLSQHGKDFKRIAASMPNKTTIQVSNYYKSHLKEWDLEKIAAGASSRSSSPEQDRFVSVSLAEASQSRTPEEVTTDTLRKDLDDRQVVDATSGIGRLTLEQNGCQFSAAPPNTRTLSNKSFINVLNPGAFQDAGSSNSRGVITSARGNSLYSFGIGRPPPLLRNISSPIPQNNSLSFSPQLPSPGLQEANGQTQSASQHVPHLHRYVTFHTQMLMAISPAHIGAMPFVPAGARGLFVPARDLLIQASPRPGEYQSGLPLHMLPAGHPGLPPSILRPNSNSNPNPTPNPNSNANPNSKSPQHCSDLSKKPECRD